MLMSTPAERASLAASEPLAANPELPRWEVNVPGSCSDPWVHSENYTQVYEKTKKPWIISWWFPLGAESSLGSG